MSDLGEMLAYHVGKTIIAAIIIAATIFFGIGYLVGKFL